ncbi:hypothetical protein [Adlercreutzia faecimuris]|uniref:Uncharacterized protein n=1 Tax=Adlercreutzia faecimuris TaxID=2897341 RepID=A0ABS9WGV1_9ACTN|nr:hypothetical protein [Adlercreutzia sp. JBNU-10]MCI2242088.1 hypothetical protein [Adlercreutzia sp. JBNU-10]
MNKILDKLKGVSTCRVAAIVATLLLAVLVAGLAACSAATFSSEAGAVKAVGDAAAGIIDEARGIEFPEQGDEDNEASESSPQDAEDAEPDSGDAPSRPSPEPGIADRAQASGGTGDPGGSSQNTGSAYSAGSAQAPAQQKKWVEDTEQVWVEDKAAWSEQVPVYGTKEVSICNICGQDITGNTSAHGKAHMIAGEGSGHHSEVRREVTGYNTVSHPAEGHWETRVVGGHWE